MRLFTWAACAGLLGLGLAGSAVGCGGSGSGNGEGPGSGATDAAGGADQQAPHPEAGAPGTDAAGGADASTESGIEDASNGDVTEAAPAEAAAFAPGAHTPWPVLIPNAGVVLHDMKLVIVASSGDPLASDYFAFGDALITSAWWQSFAGEYALGTPTASVHVTGAAITTGPTSAQMVSYISAAVTASSDAGANANGDTMYMLFLPAGVDIQDQRGPNTNCQYYGGYHTTFDKSGDAWGVVQHCPVSKGATDEQWMTIGASHEIAEAATDPIPSNGYTLVPQINYNQPWTQSPWAATLYGEVGDMCVGTQIVEGSFMYQRIWSIAAAAKELDPCVPPAAPNAFENTSAPQGWYTVTPGGSVNIPFTSWTDRATPDWIVGGGIWSQSGTGYTASFTSPTTKSGNFSTNNGKGSTLTLTAPATAAPGSWAVGFVQSETFANSGDQYHLWMVGAYVQ